MNRIQTRPINVGGVQIGGQNKVVIQSMTNTKTKNVKDTVDQILRLEEAGCEIIRVAILDMDDAKAISSIKKQIHIPIVCDIHFNPDFALEAIRQGTDKIRLNPGNIEDEDKKVLKGLGNLLGQTDIRGQVNQIELTNNFLDEQISKAITQKEKNEKLYRSLGMIIGIAIVIVLV